MNHAAAEGGHHRHDRDEKERWKDAGDQRGEHGHRKPLGSALDLTPPAITKLGGDAIESVGQRRSPLTAEEQHQAPAVRTEVAPELFDHGLPGPAAAKAVECSTKDPIHRGDAGLGRKGQSFGRNQPRPDRQAQHVERLGKHPAQFVAVSPTVVLDLVPPQSSPTTPRQRTASCGAATRATRPSPTNTPRSCPRWAEAGSRGDQPARRRASGHDNRSRLGSVRLVDQLS